MSVDDCQLGVKISGLVNPISTTTVARGTRVRRVGGASTDLFWKCDKIRGVPKKTNQNMKSFHQHVALMSSKFSKNKKTQVPLKNFLQLKMDF